MKRILKLIVLVGISLLSKVSFAQQFAFYSMYQNNWHIINPAAPSLTILEMETQNIVNVSYRQQWIGINGSPSNYNIDFEHDELKGNNAKWGLGLYGETAGALVNNTLYCNYAYPITLGGTKKNPEQLFIGFNAGYLLQQINFNGINFQNGIDQTAKDYINDQKIFNGQGYFEWTPGLFYTNNQNVYVGLSAPRLVTAGKFGGSPKVFNPTPQVQLMAGMYEKYEDKEYSFQPSIWLRWQSTIDYESIIKNSPISATVSLKKRIAEEVTLGMGISSSKEIHFETGWAIREGKYWDDPSFQINIAYDLPLYQTGFNLGQTGEVNLVFAF